MGIYEDSIAAHAGWHGKLEVAAKVPVNTKEALSLAYTPGVAGPCLEIQKNLDLSYELTGRWNTVAVITDGTAVLGLGDIGPEAGMPVMEGKCVLFKAYGDVDAFPICLRTKEVDKIVETIALMAGSFGGVNLEDIAAPRCFEIEEALKKRCDIPIFHDDQHGTAIVVLAALTNALKVARKEAKNVSVVVNGAGAAGTAITKLLLANGVADVVMCDKKGIISKDEYWLNSHQRKMADVTNLSNKRGDLTVAMRGADVFIGVSAPNCVTQDMVRSMAKGAIVFAMANPTPEIMPDLAREAGALVVGTGRSDFPNQINNLLAFPGVFKGTLAARASDINEEMKVSAAKALAGMIGENELSAENIIPSPMNEKAANTVARAVAEAAFDTHVARVTREYAETLRPEVFGVQEAIRSEKWSNKRFSIAR
ncbi:malate dehydrogenase [Clostridia bacterium]|nr:malate dehydrogenase [Clostridia bacterium]